MNKFIKEQLDKCKIVLPAYNNDSTILNIPKNSGVARKLQDNTSIVVGGSYNVFIENYIINEPETFTLSATWNNGTKPPENKLKIVVIKTMGKMIQVEAIGISTGIHWSGWLPQKSITILEV